MTTNATAIRDAVFQRASLIVPTGFLKWGVARICTLPTLGAALLPALQVILTDERLSPDGDADVGIPRFLSETTIKISVLRGVADPTVFDGQADQDIDNILNSLLTDSSFISPPADSPFYFRGISRIDNERHSIMGPTEAYMFEFMLSLTFEFQCEFIPIIGVPLTSVAVTISEFANITG